MEDNIKYTDDFIKLWNNRPWHLKQISDKTKAFNWYNEGKKSGKCKELEEENKRLKSKVGILQRLSDRQKSTIIKWIEEYNIPPIKSGLDPTLDIFNQH